MELKLSSGFVQALILVCELTQELIYVLREPNCLANAATQVLCSQVAHGERTMFLHYSARVQVLGLLSAGYLTQQATGTNHQTSL